MRQSDERTEAKAENQSSILPFHQQLEVVGGEANGVRVRAFLAREVFGLLLLCCVEVRKRVEKAAMLLLLLLSIRLMICHITSCRILNITFAGVARHSKRIACDQATRLQTRT